MTTAITLHVTYILARRATFIYAKLGNEIQICFRKAQIMLEDQWYLLFSLIWTETLIFSRKLFVKNGDTIIFKFCRASFLIHQTFLEHLRLDFYQRFYISVYIDLGETGESEVLWKCWIVPKILKVEVCWAPRSLLAKKTKLGKLSNFFKVECFYSDYNTPASPSPPTPSPRPSNSTIHKAYQQSEWEEVYSSLKSILYFPYTADRFM